MFSPEPPPYPASAHSLSLGDSFTAQTAPEEKPGRPPTTSPRNDAPPADDDRVPVFAPEAPAIFLGRSWSEERIVVTGFVLLAFLAGLIIVIASTV